jgi:DNA polymerase III alpha subunit
MSLKDAPGWISLVEEAFLGISLTCTIIDECDADAANTTCKDFHSGIISKDGVLMAAKIDRVKEIVTKQGKSKGAKMAFIEVSDSTASLESVVLFPEVWSQYKSKFFVDNTLMLAGNRGREKDSFIVTKVWQI